MPAHYLGLATSLHPFLEEQYVVLLERAIWLNNVGKYQEARHIFEQDLAPIKELPIVLIEHSKLYLDHGRYGEVYRLLEKPLQDRSNQEDILDRPEWRLIALNWVLVMTRHKGILGPAIAELHRVQRWLANIPVSEYTDIQALCACLLVMVHLFVRFASKWDDPNLELIPKPIDGHGAYSGLEDLRSSLITRGMVKEAMAVFRVELFKTPLSQRSTKAHQVVDILTSLPLLDNRSWLLANVRQQHTKSLVDVRDLNGASELAIQCESDLEIWCMENHVDPILGVPLWVSLQEMKLNFVSDPNMRLARVEEILPYAEKSFRRLVVTLLNHGAEAAAKVAMTTSLPDFSIYYTFRERAEHEDEFVQEDLCGVVGHRFDMYAMSQRTLVDQRKELEWIDGFIAKYPNFQSPETLKLLYISRGTILATLNDKQGAKWSHAEADRWSKLASSSEPVYHYDWASIIVPDASRDSEDEMDNGSFLYKLSWCRSNPEALQGSAQKTLHLIIDWAFGDVQDELLGLEKFQVILNLDDTVMSTIRAGESQPCQDSLKAQNSSLMFRALFVPDLAKDDAKEKRFRLLFEWLSEPPKGQRNIRLYCLLNLMQMWNESFANADKSLLHLRLRGLEQLIDFQARLPSSLKVYTAFLLPFWQSSLSLHYLSMFWKSGSWSLFDSWHLILQSEAYSKQSLEGHQRYNNLGQIALCRRHLALITWCKIRRLTILKVLLNRETRNEREAEVTVKLTADQIPGLTIDDQVRQLREEALQWLRETDDILSASEREASWKAGLDGIKERIELAERWQSYTTTRQSIQLLLANPDPLTKEEKVSLWDLVQKYKTRLLSMSIGMYRPSPLAVINKILASADCAPMYHQMVDLQDKIETAEAKDRFHLRRQLDAHRRRMRQHQPLRQLINLREGTPIELHEVEEISERAGGSIVLVDWYFVSEPIGENHLLLLTARSSETPTIDYIQVSRAEVERWVQRNLNSSEEDDDPEIGQLHARTSFDEVCGALVAPLLVRTKPGETLVLSPTEVLHRLPLHALKVGAEALIHRNPIAYAHSHSLLRICFLAAEYAAERTGSLNPQFIAGIAASDNAYYDAGRQSIYDLAKAFNTEPMIDETASKSCFLNRAQTSRLLHIHTHCFWDSETPLDHHLEFPAQDISLLPSRTQTQQRNENSGLPKSRILTAREIFDLNFIQGLHINMIACSGGLTEVKSGDEVMGLVPALLHSGASSTVSTLWPILDSIGAKFARGFFKAFRDSVECMIKAKTTAQTESKGNAGTDEMQQEGVKWVNLAQAVQKAIAGLDPDQNQPLSTWAGFIMHGFWMFSISGDERI